MTDIWRGWLVRLRGVEPEDWETFCTWNSNSDTARMFDYAWFPTSETRGRRWAEETSRRSVAVDTFHFAIEALDGGTQVVSIDTHHCDRRVGSFSYGVGTIPERRRRGYASEAILLVARYYFQELRYQKMNAQAYTEEQDQPQRRARGVIYERFIWPQYSSPKGRRHPDHCSRICRTRLEQASHSVRGLPG